MDKYDSYLKELTRQIDRKRIYTDPLRTLAWGTDAGFYRLIPRMVVRLANEEEASLALRTASELDIPVTFRAAGTSLSGQAISDSVLLVAGKSWEKFRILDKDATAIALQPGIIGARVNEILRPYRRIFTPDPASVKSAMVGGIVANNASGMKCGTHANSDRMLRSIRVVLADGTILDTADETSREAFRNSHGALLDELVLIRDMIRGDSELSELIKFKYSIKNVTGLNLRPFIAYDDPFDILAHCMVGSEGTLAFISEVTFKTEAQMPFSASAMVYFSSPVDAAHAVIALRKSGTVQACELLDNKSLRSVGDTHGEGLTALLLTTEAFTKEELDRHVQTTLDTIAPFRPAFTPHFSTDPEEVAEWWKIRAGIFPAVGGTRPSGTTVLIEDVAFHIEDLADGIVELSKLLEDCGYDEACIYGHALAGNFHFIISQSFETQADIDKYKHLMNGIETLIVGRYNGSLKAEHGTGRNMAPFVEAEWGHKAWEIMKRVKDAFDPAGILNPGVIFNDDPECYVRSMKPMPMCDPAVDRCIECGFCEVNCVSCGLTLSARQRIVTQREMARLRKDGSDPARLAELEKEFIYYGRETCAGDGLCSTSCPMGINTADLIHKIRNHDLTNNQRHIGKWAAEHLGAISDGLRLALGAADTAHAIIGDKGVDNVGKALHKIGVPLWTAALPAPFSPRHLATTAPQERKVVYFPSCLNRVMGPGEEDGKKTEALADVFVRLCNKAGYQVIFPDDMENLCCGMIWESKGMPEIADAKTAELEAALLKAADGGRIPVVCDQSPCLHRMREHIGSMKLFEPAEFILDYLAKYLRFTPTDTPVAVHITCSTRRMALADKIVKLASMCSTRVTVPAEVGCCGFAGDKGFTFPELNRWGLRKLRPAIEASGATEGYSNSRTCEIGLTSNSGIPYKSIVYLVDRCTSGIHD